MTTRIDYKLNIGRGLPKLVGKTVVGIVAAHHNDGHPRSRLFLTFSDGSAFEIWTDEEDLSIASALDEYTVEQLVDMLGRRNKTKVRAIQALHEDPDAVQRDFLSDAS